jgi:hypothetical protein
MKNRIMVSNAVSETAYRIHAAVYVFSGLTPFCQKSMKRGLPPNRSIILLLQQADPKCNRQLSQDLAWKHVCMTLA